MPSSWFSSSSRLVDVILVPQGSEFNAVKRGLMSLGQPQPPPRSQESGLLLLQAIPVGPEPLEAFLRDWHPSQQFNQPPRVLIMGLCGALAPIHKVGDVVLYDTCVNGLVPDFSSSQSCDVEIRKEILQKLERDSGDAITEVQALTMSQVVFRAAEKAALSQDAKADVVDMEGWVALRDLRQRGMTIAMLRVVSDDCTHDLPDLSAAFSPTGQLLPLPLAVGMLQRPLAAIRLIRGSLMGLKKLERLAAALIR